MINKLTNNLPRAGYYKPKIYTANTGLFASSPLFTTATYGTVVGQNTLEKCRLKLQIIYNSLYLHNKLIEIKFDKIYHANHIHTIIDNENYQTQLNIDSSNESNVSDVKIPIIFYLNNYYQGTIRSLDFTNKLIKITNSKQLMNISNNYRWLSNSNLLGESQLNICIIK